jgi:hypothetical protein
MTFNDIMLVNPTQGAHMDNKRAAFSSNHVARALNIEPERLRQWWITVSTSVGLTEHILSRELYKFIRMFLSSTPSHRPSGELPHASFRVV